MPDNQGEPNVINPFGKREKVGSFDESVDLDNAKMISPFKVINRGDDTVNADNQVVFADFSPVVLPADTPEEIVEVAPKGGSAPGLAPSSALKQTTEQTLSEIPVPTPVDQGDGTLKLNDDLKQPSSIDPKSGPSEPDA